MKNKGKKQKKSGTDIYFLSDRSLKFIALFMTALFASLSVPQASLGGLLNIGNAGDGNTNNENGSVFSTLILLLASAKFGTGAAQAQAATILISHASPSPNYVTLTATATGAFSRIDIYLHNEGTATDIPETGAPLQSCTTSPCSFTVSLSAGTYSYYADLVLNDAIIAQDPPGGAITASNYVKRFTVLSSGTVSSTTLPGQYYLCNNVNDPNYNKCVTSFQQCLGGATGAAPGLLTQQQCQQIGSAIGAGVGTGTGASSSQSCSDCRASGGTFCVFRSQNFNVYSTQTIQSTSCITGAADNAQECRRRGGDPQTGAACPNLCEEVCTSYVYGGLYYAQIGQVGGTNIQNLGIPIGTCSPLNSPPISVYGTVITQTSGQQIVNQPRPIGSPGTYCENRQDVCWCTVFQTGTIFGGTGSLGGPSTIPGTTATRNWAPPRFNAPRAEPNQVVCNLPSGSTNSTLRAQLVGADGNPLALVIAGTPVTVTGDIGALSSVCSGYSYQCLVPDQKQCEVSSGFWKDTYKYQACDAAPAGAEDLGRIASKGSGSKWHFGRIITLVAIGVLTAGALGAFGPAIQAAILHPTAAGISTADRAFVAAIQAAMVLAPTLDGCNPNYLAAGPLLQQLNLPGGGSGGVSGCILITNKDTCANSGCVWDDDAQVCGYSGSGTGIGGGAGGGTGSGCYVIQDEEICSSNPGCLWNDNFGCYASTSGTPTSGGGQPTGGTSSGTPSSGSGGQQQTTDLCAGIECGEDFQCNPSTGDCEPIQGGTGGVVAGAANSINIPSSGQQKAQEFQQRITGQQLPGCNTQQCRQTAALFLSGLNGLRSCSAANEPRECWSVCGWQYQTDVGAAPLCDQGGSVCDYDKASRSCTQNSAVAGTYECAARSCGGSPDAIVNIRVVGPDGALLLQNQTRTHADGTFDYTFDAPDVDGEVTVIVSTPLQGTVVLTTTSSGE